MGCMKRFCHNDTGFTVVEFVIAAAILFIVSTGVMGALAYASTATQSDAMRQHALELANQRMEQVRNMPYADLGTPNGYPTGTIPTPEDVTVVTPNGDAEFVVTTVVSWAIDSETGAPADKNVRITVSWTTPRSSSVTVESNVAGKFEALNRGHVKVNVVDEDTSQPVVGATINIKPSTGPRATSVTNSEGFVYWGNVPSGSIVITGTCSTHYLDMSPVSGASVLDGLTNEWTIQAVRASSGTVHVTDTGGSDLPGVAVTIIGPPGSADWSCPSGTATAISDSNGNATFSRLRKGSYAVSGVLSGFQQQSSPPSLSINAGGSSFTSQLRMDRRTTILATVRDASNNPLSGVTLTATGDTVVTFAATTDTNGQATSNDMGAIGSNETFVVTAAKTGYVTNTATVTMSQYTQGTVAITLTPVPPTTIRVTVLDASNNPIPGVTVSATGVTFASTTDSSGRATSNDMGAIGTNKTYTVTAAKSGWVPNSGTVTFSQYTQGTLTIVLAPAPVTGTLIVKYTSTVSGSRTIYIYNTNTPKTSLPIASGVVYARNGTVTFTVPPGTYWASRGTPFGGANGTTYSPNQAIVTSGNTTNVSISSSD